MSNAGSFLEPPSCGRGTVIFTIWPKPHRGRTESYVRHVQVAIRPEGQRGRQEESCSDFLESIVGDTQNFSSIWRQEGIACGVFENVHVALAIESYAQDGGHTRNHGFHFAMPVNL
jgi:hypothetical protein